MSPQTYENRRVQETPRMPSGALRWTGRRANPPLAIRTFSRSSTCEIRV
jgi:hypothetical protein